MGSAASGAASWGREGSAAPTGPLASAPSMARKTASIARAARDHVALAHDLAREYETISDWPRFDAWLQQHELRPEIVGEFSDSALLKTFGQGGIGLFAAPTASEEDVIQHVDPVCPPYPDCFTAFFKSRTDVVASGFGEVAFMVGDRLRVIPGLRVDVYSSNDLEIGRAHV